MIRSTASDLGAQIAAGEVSAVDVTQASTLALRGMKALYIIPPSGGIDRGERPVR